MNTARISSTRSLQTICLTLLLGIAAYSLTPANAIPRRSLCKADAE